MTLSLGLERGASRTTSSIRTGWRSPRAGCICWPTSPSTRTSGRSPSTASRRCRSRSRRSRRRRTIGDEVFANSLGVNTGPAAQVEIEFEPRVAPYVRARVWHASQQLREGGGRDARPVDERVPRLGAAQLDSELGSVRAGADAGVAGQRDCEHDLQAATADTSRAHRPHMLKRPVRASRLRRAGVPVLRRPVADPLLHRLAVVRRGRLPAGVPRPCCGPGDAVHDRLRDRGGVADGQPARRRWPRSATCGRSSRRAKASRCRCPDGSRCSTIAVGARDRRRRAHRPLRRRRSGRSG